MVHLIVGTHTVRPMDASWDIYKLSKGGSTLQGIHAKVPAGKRISSLKIPDSFHFSEGK